MKRLNKVVGIFIAVILLLFSVVWLLSPMISHKVIKDVLAPHNLTLSDDSHVRINLFTARITIRDLHWARSETTHFNLDALILDVDILPLFTKKIKVEMFTVRGMHAFLSLNDEGTRIVGFSADSEAPVSEPEELDDGEEKPLKLDIELKMVSFKDISIELDYEGRHQIFNINELALNDIEFDGSELVTSMALNAVLNQELIKEGYERASSDIARLALAINVASNVRVNLSSEGQQVTLNDFSLALNDIFYAMPDLAAGIDELTLTSDVLEFTTHQGAHQLTTNLGLSVDGIEALSFIADETESLLNVSSIRLPSIQTSLQDQSVQVQIERLDVAKIAASKLDRDDLPALVELEAFTLEDIDFMHGLDSGESALEIASVLLDSLKATALLSAEGKVDNLVSIATAENDTDAQEQESNNADVTENDQTVGDTAVPLKLEIANIALSSPAIIRVNDKSVSPVFDKTFTVETLTIKDIDNQNIDMPTLINAVIKDTDYFQLDVGAKLKPFKEKLNLELDLNIREFPVYEVSYYVDAALDFGIEAGQLDVDTQITVVDDILDGDAVLNLRGAKFSAGGEAEADDGLDVVGQAAVPLNVALGMLKDGDGNIKLKIPLNGDVNDPDFGVQYIIGLVVKKAVMQQAKSYLVNTFIPYGQVLSVAYSAGSYALKVRFEDVIYTPTQIEIGESQAVFMTQFVTLLKKKEDLQVRVCAVATRADIQLGATSVLSDDQRAQLVALAKKRASAFKKSATAEGIASSRLLLCSPEIDNDSEAQPRIELSI